MPAAGELTPKDIEKIEKTFGEQLTSEELEKLIALKATIKSEFNNSLNAIKIGHSSQITKKEYDRIEQKSTPELNRTLSDPTMRYSKSPKKDSNISNLNPSLVQTKTESETEVSTTNKLMRQGSSKNQAQHLAAEDRKFKTGSFGFEQQLITPSNKNGNKDAWLRRSLFAPQNKKPTEAFNIFAPVGDNNTDLNNNSNNNNNSNSGGSSQPSFITNSI
jgi:hypothetical protein